MNRLICLHFRLFWHSWADDWHAISEQWNEQPNHAPLSLLISQLTCINIYMQSIKNELLELKPVSFPEFGGAAQSRLQ